MSPKPIASPDDQPVTFVELFFDLVFVFSVTQVVVLLHHHLDWPTVGKALLVFWLVWWAWTQFTWALNAANTLHPWIQLGTLVAVGVAMFMAVALPQAFGERALWFALTYVLVRAIGLGLYIWVAAATPDFRHAVDTFALLSVGGLAAVIAGGYLGGAAQLWLWGLAIGLDLLAARVGGNVDGWNLQPEHFAERHGLFVIIALGETLIVAASLVTDATWTPPLILLTILVVAITCVLWWSYFPRAKPVLDAALCKGEGSGRVQLARDAFSVLHFPMMFGVIVYAAGVEQVLAHPDEPVALAGRLALAAGLMLFVGGTAVALKRASGRWLAARLGIVTATAATLVLLPDPPPVLAVGLALAGLLAVVGLEARDAELDPPEHGGELRDLVD